MDISASGVDGEVTERETFLALIDRQLSNTALPSKPLTFICVRVGKFRYYRDREGDATARALRDCIRLRLHGALPPESSVGQIGDRTYLVMLEHTMDQSRAVCERIGRVLTNPFIIDERMMQLVPHIGLVPAAGIPNSREVVRRATLCAREHLTLGGSYRVYDEESDRQQWRLRTLEIDIRKAIHLDQFRLLFQPQIDLRGNRICGFESLARWQHPELGMVSPLDFIAVAENNGAIVELGAHVLYEACKAAREWPHDIRVAVNVSPRQIELSDLVQTVRSVVAQTGLPPERLELEVTESLPLDNNPRAIETLRHLASDGHTIALDDFGVGFASLNHLQQFPFGKLKIDQSFIRPKTETTQNDLIVESMVSLGQALEMAVVAEGIETEEKLEQLRRTGCEQAQGFLFSKPVSLNDTFTLLHQWNAIPPRCVVTPLETKYIDKPRRSGGELYRLVYFSDNLIDIGSVEGKRALDGIMRSAVDNNSRMNVTGALMFNRHQFAQVLEGSAQAVQGVFEKIQGDDRHGNLCVVDFAPVDERGFSRWSMAFIEESAVNREDFHHLASITHFSEEHLQGSELYSLICDAFRRSEVLGQAA